MSYAPSREGPTSQIRKMIKIMTYKIIRFYRDHDYRDVIATGLTLEEAQAHCRTDETHRDADDLDNEQADLGPWFDGWEEEEE